MKPVNMNNSRQKPQSTLLETEPPRATRGAPAPRPPVDDFAGDELMAAGSLDEGLLSEIEGTTGLDEVDGEDYKLPLYTFNMKWKDPKTNRPIPIDVFFNTLTEEYKPVVRCVLLRLKKTHRMATYIDGVGTKVLCRSMDRVNGVMEDGTTRSCQGCPDFRWQSEPDGKGGVKRIKPCGVNYHFIAYDLDTRQPFLIRVKGTSMDPAKIYLNRFFLKKRRTPNGLVDLPLYVFETVLRLRMSDNCNYSILEFDRGAVLPPEMVREFHVTAAEFAKLDQRELDREQPEIIDGDNADVPLTRLVRPAAGEPPTQTPHF